MQGHVGGPQVRRQTGEEEGDQASEPLNKEQNRIRVNGTSLSKIFKLKSDSFFAFLQQLKISKIEFIKRYFNSTFHFNIRIV